MQMQFGLVQSGYGLIMVISQDQDTGLSHHAGVQNGCLVIGNPLVEGIFGYKEDGFFNWEAYYKLHACMQLLLLP